MIICFTGTGNSRFIADALADRLGDEVVSMNDILKNGLPKEFGSEKPYVIVCPVYAWRIPRHVDSFIRESVFKGSRKVYLVVTMGADCGKADVYASGLFEGTEMEFMGLSGIVMTDNYTWKSIPRPEAVEETNRKALEALEPVIDGISKGERIVRTDKSRFRSLKSGPVNNMFVKYACEAGYTVSEDCTGCGLCAGFCPAGNIVMTDGKPVIGKNCFCCYGCLHRCPQTAINIKGKSEGCRRFVCPEYRPGTR